MAQRHEPPALREGEHYQAGSSGKGFVEDRIRAKRNLGSDFHPSWAFPRRTVLCFLPSQWEGQPRVWGGESSRVHGVPLLSFSAVGWREGSGDADHGKSPNRT